MSNSYLEPIRSALEELRGVYDATGVAVTPATICAAEKALEEVERDAQALVGVRAGIDLAKHAVVHARRAAIEECRTIAYCETMIDTNGPNGLGWVQCAEYIEKKLTAMLEGTP